MHCLALIFICIKNTAMKTPLCRIAIMMLASITIAFTAKAGGWVQVGDTLDGDAYGCGAMHIAFGPANEPYVFYQRSSGLGRDYVVRKFNGSRWEELGSPDIYDGNSTFGFAVDKDGAPYIATDSSYSDSRLIVKKYDGNAWVQVGDTRRFTRGGYANNDGITIAFDSAGMT